MSTVIDFLLDGVIWLGALWLALLALGFVAFKLFCWWAEWAGKRFQRTAEPALDELQDSLHEHFADAGPPIRRLMVGWGYGQPQVMVQFTSKQDDHRSLDAGPRGSLRTQVREHVERAVSSDERFGNRRRDFDATKGVTFTSDAQTFDELLDTFADARVSRGREPTRAS